jgi:sugar phosphate isomerase/epimerase
MEIGASTGLLQHEPLGMGVLNTMKSNGIDILELSDYHVGFTYADQAAFTTLKANVDQLGLRVQTLHSHLLHHDPTCQLTAAAPDAREHLLTKYCQAIDAFAAIGGGIMVTHDHGIPDVAAAEHEAALETLIENLEAITRYAAARNVRIAVENLTKGYFSDPAHLVALVEDVDLANIGICIDTGHRNLHGDVATALRLVDKHLFTVHIHDNHGDRDAHLLPTRGTINWPTVLQALADIRYPGVFMYELSRPEDLPLVCENFAQLGQGQ